MKILCLSLLLTLDSSAAVPSPTDQIEIQNALKLYVLALNDCNEAGARAVVTRDFSAVAPGMGPIFSGRLRPSPPVCSTTKSEFELTTLLRFFLVATGDVVISDGYFRTLQLPGGDKAGRLYATFVKREQRWQLLALRFHSLQFEKPYIGIEAAAKHDQPGPSGWITLFDGHSTDAFLDISGGPFPATWTMEGALLKTIAGKNRSLRTRDTYRSFELRFEWKASPKGNSGIKYHLFFLLDGTGGSDGTGHEYQLADDAGDPGAIQFPVERSGGLYNQIAPLNAITKPLGEFNESAIIVRGRHVEHWLNGTKVVEYESESRPPEGPLVFQHHETEMWFRNIRIRRLDESR